MALFETDLIALIIVVATGLGIYVINKIVSFILNKVEKISIGTKIKALFGVRIISLIAIIYLIVDGFPIIDTIDPTYVAILTASISTAIAFASSGIFNNLVAGIVLLMIRPFEIGDVVKLGADLGVVRRIKLTKVSIETFDNIRIEKANSDVISQNVINYSVNLGSLRRFINFKDKIHYTENLYPSLVEEINQEEEDENMLKNMFNSIFSRSATTKVHNYIFQMNLPFEGFLKRIDKIESICKKYKEHFKFKPRYHIEKFGREITLKFRIFTHEPNLLFEYQPLFANDLYEIISGEL